MITTASRIKEDTPKERLRSSIEELVNTWIDTEDKYDSIDFKLELLRDASAVFWRFQDECDSIRQDIAEACEGR